ncbi:MAG: hypothetical protein K8F27_12020 [Sulfuricellaceae bacterium]|nr:hypothetical protein [Sulfuricellaceae bacterium]
MNKKHKRGRSGIVRRLGASLLGAFVFSLGIVPAAEAVPARIIILRHGEKQDSYKLCATGQQRSLALAANYLGKGAANSLFPSGAGPDGIFAITLHTLELASPAAQSWNLPLQLYSIVPLPNQSKKDELTQLNRRTREAAEAVLTDPRWDGKTVVMVWEHHHIADKKLEKQFPGEKVTFRQLFHLDTLPDVPKSWHGGNYDYFWIVDFNKDGSATPTQFTAQKQVFPAPYQAVPSNDWGTPENLPKHSGCKS